MRILFTILVLLTLAVTSATAAPELQAEMFPLDELKPGLKGIGKTVIRGTNIQEFDVEILELVPKGGFDGGPMILARFSGEVVDFSNGIAGGYSGSPVYIGNKLLGAVSMAIPFTDTHIGGITPIQQMIKALPEFEEPDYTNNTVLPPTEKNGIELSSEGNRISYFTDLQKAREFNEQSTAAGSNQLAAVLAKTPVYFSHISPAVLENFGADFSALLGPQLELVNRPMGTAGDMGLLLSEGTDAPGLLLKESDSGPPLIPGDAVALSIMEGDIEAAAIGTLTYSDDSGNFLALGHPFFQNGDSNLPVGKAYITWTHKSIMRAFKDGVRLNSVGTMTKDHAAAVGGSFEIEPDMIPVRLKIKDVDTDVSRTLRFKVIRHEDFTPMLIAMGLNQGAMEVLDRAPSGTMKLSYHIEGVGLKEPLRRTNYYTDDMDVISNGAWDIMPVSGLLETNIYREVNVTKVDVLVEITRNRVNASIDNAEFILEEEDSETEVKAEDSEEDDEDEEKNETEKEEIPEIEEFFGPGGDDEVSLNPDYLQELQETEGDEPPAVEQLNMQIPDFGNIPVFNPGDEIRVKVRLQPFRTEPVWREFKVEVPRDFPSGQTMVIVHGGGDLISFSELQGKGRSLFGMGPVIDVEERDLDSILDQIMEWPLNNELLVTLQRPFDPAAAKELGNGDNEPDEAVDSKYMMEWVIYNGFMLPVNIMSKDEEAEAGSPLSDKLKEEMEKAKAGSEAEDEDSEDDDQDDDDRKDRCLAPAMTPVLTHPGHVQLSGSRL